MRKKNLEIRKTKSLRDEYYTEIVKWYPNIYYGNKHHYREVEPGMYKKINGEPWETYCSVHESCFENPECCYTLATIDNRDDEEPNIVSVGSRPFDLNEEERCIFYELVKGFYEDYRNRDCDDE